MSRIENKPECLELVPEVFRFVEAAIVSALPIGGENESVRFELVFDEGFNASVHKSSSSSLVVCINVDAVVGIYERCNELSVILDHEDNGLIGLTYTSALIFLILHEFSHVVAGHLNYISDHFPDHLNDSLGWATVSKNTQDANYSHFRKMAELEADGTAFALVLEFADEICKSIDLAADTDAETIQRSILLGCFITICSLDGLFEPEASSEYPFAATRLINLCSSYLRVVDSDIVSWKNGDHRFSGADDASVHMISENYQKTILPAITDLHQTLMFRSVKSEFFGVSGVITDEEPTNFMKDVMAVLGGSRPVNTPFGLELSTLSEDRASFMTSLDGYRKLDLWL